MNCPHCNQRTSVTDSRTDGNCVNRKRVCPYCGYVFKTIELEEDRILARPKRKSVCVRIEYDPTSGELDIIKKE